MALVEFRIKHKNSRTAKKNRQRLMQEPLPNISAVPDEQNAHYFHVVIAGPEGSPFEGGVFKLEL